MEEVCHTGHLLSTQHFLDVLVIDKKSDLACMHTQRARGRQDMLLELNSACIACICKLSPQVETFTSFLYMSKEIRFARLPKSRGSLLTA